MLWQQISLQPVLQDLKNAPRVLPDWASSPTRWLKVYKSWLPVKGQSQRQQQACKSPLNQVGSGNKRQDRHKYGDCPSLSGVLSVVSQQPGKHSGPVIYFLSHCVSGKLTEGGPADTSEPAAIQAEEWGHEICSSCIQRYLTQQETVSGLNSLSQNLQNPRGSLWMFYSSVS